MDGREPSRLTPSEPLGMMVGPNSYPNSSMGIPNSTGLMSGMRLSFNGIPSSRSKAVESPNTLYQGDDMGGVRQVGVLSMGEPMKKKRGRPRKYGPDGSMALALCPNRTSSPMSDPSSKKRGRPLGSGRKQQLDALGSAGIAFTPHVITVKAGEKIFRKYVLAGMGVTLSPKPPLSLPDDESSTTLSLPQAAIFLRDDESTPLSLSPKLPLFLSLTTTARPLHLSPKDVASKIMAFSQQGPRTVCILSANGAICNVTLRQPATSGGTVTYEGRWEIISLSGSFLLSEIGGTRSRTGGLSVSLAGSDGRVLGGGVAGMLMAATPVQVVMGSFIAEGKKPKPEPKRETSSAPSPQMQGFRAPSATSPPSHGMSSESDDDDDPGSPTMNLSGSGATFNSGQHGHGHGHGQIMPAYNSVGSGWGHCANHQPRHDSDMKLMPN